MKLFLGSILAIAAMVSTANAEENRLPVVFMIGDSTMANKNTANGNPERGWGQLLPEFFGPTVRIDNRAKDGRSTRSFIDEGLWDAALENMKAGDWLIIEFGHNDQKKDKPNLYAAVDSDYRLFLTKFVNEAEAKGVHPIVVSSIYRLRFGPDGTVKSTLGAYPQAAREVAEELKIPFVDLHASTGQLLQAAGETKSKEFFLHFEPGELPLFPEGKHDNTHLSEKGARQVALLFVEQLRAQKLPLVQNLKEP